jgi:hypothetical protein
MWMNKQVSGKKKVPPKNGTRRVNILAIGIDFAGPGYANSDIQKLRRLPLVYTDIWIRPTTNAEHMDLQIRRRSAARPAGVNLIIGKAPAVR